MGWLITLGVLTLLAVLPLGVSVKYNAEGILLRLIAGPVRITLLPARKKDKKPKKEGPKKKNQKRKKKTDAAQAGQESSSPETKPAAKEAPAKQKKASGGSWTDFLPLVRVVFDLLGDFRRKLRVNVLEMKLIMAADDPCDLAVNYGRAWAALGNLMPQLERLFVIKKRDLQVECDFTAGETLVIARLDLSITLGRLLAMVFVFAGKALFEFLKIMKKRKGGAVK